MAWYNGLHLVVSLAIGLIITWLVAQAERRPARAHLAGLTIVTGFFVTILGVGLLTVPMRPVLPWWSIVVANVLAVLLAGSYLLQKHPGVWRHLIPFIG
jgi:amino acid transporter